MATYIWSCEFAWAARPARAVVECTSAVVLLHGPACTNIFQHCNSNNHCIHCSSILPAKLIHLSLVVSQHYLVFYMKMTNIVKGLWVWDFPEIVKWSIYRTCEFSLGCAAANPQPATTRYFIMASHLSINRTCPGQDFKYMDKLGTCLWVAFL